MKKFKQFFLEKKISDKLNFAILLPGGFKPPTLGHYELIKKYSELVEKVIVLIGPKERDGFTREQSLKVFELYGLMDLPNVEIISIPYVNPMEAAFKFVSEDPRALEYKNLTFGMGSSDKEGDDVRIKRFVSYYEKNPQSLPQGLKVGIPPTITSTKTQTDVDVSATTLRAAIQKTPPDLKTLKELIPPHVSPTEFLKIFQQNDK